MEFNLIQYIGVGAIIIMVIHWFMVCWYVAAFKISMGQRQERRRTTMSVAQERVQRLMPKLVDQGKMVTTVKSQVIPFAFVTIVFAQDCTPLVLSLWVGMVVMWILTWRDLERLVDEYRRRGF